jgi:hypothetical protein
MLDKTSTGQARSISLSVIGSPSASLPTFVVGSEINTNAYDDKEYHSSPLPGAAGKFRYLHSTLSAKT